MFFRALIFHALPFHVATFPFSCCFMAKFFPRFLKGSSILPSIHPSIHPPNHAILYEHTHIYIIISLSLVGGCLSLHSSRFIHLFWHWLVIRRMYPASGGHNFCSNGCIYAGGMSQLPFRRRYCLSTCCISYPCNRPFLLSCQFFHTIMLTLSCRISNGSRYSIAEKGCRWYLQVPHKASCRSGQDQKPRLLGEAWIRPWNRQGYRP